MALRVQSTHTLTHVPHSPVFRSVSSVRAVAKRWSVKTRWCSTCAACTASARRCAVVSAASRTSPRSRRTTNTGRCAALRLVTSWRWQRSTSSRLCRTDDVRRLVSVLLWTVLLWTVLQAKIYVLWLVILKSLRCWNLRCEPIMTEMGLIVVWCSCSCTILMYIKTIFTWIFMRMSLAL